MSPWERTLDAQMAGEKHKFLCFISIESHKCHVNPFKAFVVSLMHVDIEVVSHKKCISGK